MTHLRWIITIRNFFGTMLSTREQAEVEKHAEKESYAGICDEVRIGVTLIFYLQNVVDFLALKGSKKIYESGGRCYFRCAFYRRKNFASN